MFMHHLVSRRSRTPRDDRRDPHFAFPTLACAPGECGRCVVESSDQLCFLFVRQPSRASRRLAGTGVGLIAVVNRRNRIGRYAIPGGAEYPERRLASAEGLSRAAVASR
jgi:hypothetical protein